MPHIIYNLASDIREKKQTDCISGQGAEDNIWTEEG
jgi:hypothetical protein